MTDIELLQLAAKASGNTVYSTAGLGVRSVMHWNPLDDDGDALRLAAKLRIGLGDRETTVTAFYRQGMSTGSIYVEEHDATNKARATRRAIVRAAAEVGKALSVAGQ